MSPLDRVHDRELLDQLEAINGIAIGSTFHRVTRKGRDPSRGYATNGRWSKSNELEVLYTAEEKAGALAEVGYRMTLEPIWPSRLLHEVAELSISLKSVCDLTDMARLEELGVDVGRYESHEYSETQAISAAARFLEFDGLLVPNARHHSNNLVVFTEIIDSSQIDIVGVQEVDWNGWRSKNRGLPSRSR